MSILYADDDPEDQDVFAEIVQSINPEIQIFRAEDGQKTIDILSGDHIPDIIFLDVNMPLLNGYQALAEIRKNDKLKNVEVIMYSTNMYRHSFDQHAHLNARYVRKPNTIKEGVETLRDIIEKKNTNHT